MRRLLLFDIDGTLVTGGPAKEAFHEALLEVFGTAGPIERWEFSGKTDPQIARELLTEAGLEPEEIRGRLSELWGHYLKGMEERLAANPTRALPGVFELLAELEAMERIALGLLTGNVASGARLKLDAAGVSTPFAIGAFGSDNEIRDELPAIALERAREHWGVRFPPREVVIVGDTPRDVACGRCHGARTVAVATGRFDADALRRCNPDAVLPNMTEMERALDALLG